MQFNKYTKHLRMDFIGRRVKEHSGLTVGPIGPPGNLNLKARNDNVNTKTYK